MVWEHRDPATATLVKGRKAGGSAGVLTAMDTSASSDGDFKYVVVSPVPSPAGRHVYLHIAAHVNDYVRIHNHIYNYELVYMYNYMLRESLLVVASLYVAWGRY